MIHHYVYTTKAKAKEVSAIQKQDKLWSGMRSFQKLLERTHATILEACNHGRIGVSFSGGKDSTVLLDLIRRIAPDSPAAFFDSGAELTSTYTVVREYNVDIIYPRMSIIEMCKYGGYWGYKDPVDADAVFDFGRILIDEPAARFIDLKNLAVQGIGLRADESYGRKKSASVHGELHFMKSTQIWRLCPLMKWSTQDIWAYIARFDLPYNHAYDILTDIGVPRDRQRISTILGADAETIGRYAYFKKLDPGLWNELAADFPRIREAT